MNPTQQTAADQACTQLTQDDKVFVAVGFFLADNVLCYVSTNATATIGGAQTPARLAQAKAPWYSTDAGENLEINVVKSLAKQGKLNGKLAVMSTAADQDLLNNKIKPALTAAGIKPVSSAVLDAPTNDTTATYAQAATISEKFKADGATQVLLVGESAAGSYLPGLAKTDYRPQIVLSDLNGVSAYLGNKGNDFSVLKNAISGGPFGPNDAELALGGPTKACMDVQRKAGLVIKPSSTVAPGDPDQFVASALACQQMALLTAILQKAGPTLNYGTFAAAGNSLGKIVLPTAPDAWNFGAPPNADGNPKVYLFKWDPTTSTFTIAKLGRGVSVATSASPCTSARSRSRRPLARGLRHHVRRRRHPRGRRDLGVRAFTGDDRHRRVCSSTTGTAPPSGRSPDQAVHSLCRSSPPTTTRARLQD